MIDISLNLSIHTHISDNVNVNYYFSVLFFFETPELGKPQYEPYENEETNINQDWKDQLANAVYSSVAYQTLFNTGDARKSTARFHKNGYRFKHKANQRPYNKRYYDQWNGFSKIDVPSLGNYALSEDEHDEYKK